MRVFDWVHSEIIKWGKVLTNYPVGRATSLVSVLQALILIVLLKFLLQIINVDLSMWSNINGVLVFVIIIFYLNSKRYNDNYANKLEAKKNLRVFLECLVLITIITLLIIIIV